MPNVKMKDTTASAAYGSMREGEVYTVSDEDAVHLIAAGVATKTTAKTAAEQAAADEAEPELDPAPPGTQSVTTPPPPAPPVVQHPPGRR